MYNWVDSNIDRDRTKVFFWAISSAHYKYGLCPLYLYYLEMLSLFYIIVLEQIIWYICSIIYFYFFYFWLIWIDLYWENENLVFIWAPFLIQLSPFVWSFQYLGGANRTIGGPTAATRFDYYAPIDESGMHKGVQHLWFIHTDNMIFLFYAFLYRNRT